MKTSTLCLLTLVLAFALQQGCSLQPDNTAWQGHLVDELIASWGQPDKTEQLGIDYVAYTWIESGSSCEQTFLASDGQITGYSSNGCDD